LLDGVLRKRKTLSSNKNVLRKRKTLSAAGGWGVVPGDLLVRIRQLILISPSPPSPRHYLATSKTEKYDIN